MSNYIIYSPCSVHIIEEMNAFIILENIDLKTFKYKYIEFLTISPKNKKTRSTEKRACLTVYNLPPRSEKQKYPFDWELSVSMFVK